MKKIIFLLLTTIISCNSANEGVEEILIIELNPQKTIAVIDEVLSLEIKTNKPFGRIEYSTNNFQTSAIQEKGQGDSFGTSLTAFVNTAKLGIITVSIRVSDADDISNTTIRSVDIKVEKGNAVNIKELVVNNFYDKDESWDTEFSNTDSNRLADVGFSLLKSQVNIFTGQMSQQLWYVSSIKENQGDLEWNLESENLYINPNTTIQLGLSDDDGGGIAQSLIN